MKDHLILKKHLSQSFTDYCGRFEGHYETIHELFKQLTIKHGNRLYRLKDVDFFDFRAKHYKNGNGKPMYTVVYFEIQKDHLSRDIWKHSTQKFSLYITYNKKLSSYHFSGYNSVPKVRKRKATISNKDFKFDSIINFSTKDIYEKGEHPRTW